MRKKTFEALVEDLSSSSQSVSERKSWSFSKFKPEALRVPTDDTYEINFDDYKISIEYNQTDQDKVLANRKNIFYPVKNRMASIYVDDNTDKDFPIKRRFHVYEIMEENSSVSRLHFSSYISVYNGETTKHVLANANQVLWFNNKLKYKSAFRIVCGGWLV